MESKQKSYVQGGPRRTKLCLIAESVGTFNEAECCSTKMKRVKIMITKPNPLFENWLEHWILEAALKESFLEYYFSKALKSLRKYPLPLISGKECLILEHFNLKLCCILDKKIHDSQMDNIRFYAEKEKYSFDIANDSSSKLETFVVSKNHKSNNNHVSQTRSKATIAERYLRNINNKPIFHENLFDIILLVDIHEVGRKKSTASVESTTAFLTQLGVKFEVRHLNIGDFAWIAKCNLTNKEFIIPYIVERKRLDDLCSSMRDGRYKKQKFRLRHSGIQNLIYIIEKHNKHSLTCIPLSSLMQASVNVLLRDGFIVQHTNNHKSTLSYLTHMTNILTNIYKEKYFCGDARKLYGLYNPSISSTHLMPYLEFCNNTSKQINITVREMFVRHLIRLWGISVEKAVTITEVYPTPYLLILAINARETRKGYILKSIPFKDNWNKITPITAKHVCQLYLRKKLV